VEVKLHVSSSGDGGFGRGGGDWMECEFELSRKEAVLAGSRRDSQLCSAQPVMLALLLHNQRLTNRESQSILLFFFS
jgi:hypothetical protein